MASTIKDIISPGIGFNPGQVGYIITRGFLSNSGPAPGGGAGTMYPTNLGQSPNMGGQVNFSVPTPSVPAG